MRSKNFIVIICFLICAFIYLFYRSSDTLINQIFIYIFSEEKYHSLKLFILNYLPLNPFIIYSLPEGLWIFATTLYAEKSFLKIKSFRFYLYLFPLIFCLLLEIFQLLNIIKGHFDFNDILVTILFWIFSILFIYKKTSFNIFPLNFKSIVILILFSSVYLAHVC